MAREPKETTRTDNMPQVLLLDTNDEVGGVVVVHLAMAERLPKQGVAVTVACHKTGRPRELFEAIHGLETKVVDFGTKGKRSAANPLLARLSDVTSLGSLGLGLLGLRRLVRRRGIRLMLTSDKVRSLFATSLLAGLTGLPYVYHIHAQLVDGGTTRRSLFGAAAVVANSGAMKRDYEEKLGPDCPAIEVVHNGVDAARFSPPGDGGSAVAALRASWGFGPEHLVVGMASRLAPDKGQEEFIRAAAQVIETMPAARFAIAGDDRVFSENRDYVGQLMTLAAQLGLEEKVRLVGFQTDMPTFYAALDVAVNAAHHEAFGMVVVEPMAVGIPVVGSNAGGIPEIIDHGRNGFLTEVGDPDGLAVILKRLLADEKVRALTGERARVDAVERFSIEQQMERLGAVYRRVLEGRTA